MTLTDHKHTLFICTGNYYRSRYAEALFNWHAERLGLAQRAFSRGLAIHMIEGDISPYTSAALAEHGIPNRYTPHPRAYLTRADLEIAQCIIALDESEHKPMMRKQFPDWEGSISYWNSEDTHLEDPDYALRKIEEHVNDLLKVLIATGVNTPKKDSIPVA